MILCSCHFQQSPVAREGRPDTGGANITATDRECSDLGMHASASRNSGAGKNGECKEWYSQESCRRRADIESGRADFHKMLEEQPARSDQYEACAMDGGCSGRIPWPPAIGRGPRWLGAGLLGQRGGSVLPGRFQSADVRAQGHDTDVECLVRRAAHALLEDVHDSAGP